LLADARATTTSTIHRERLGNCIPCCAMSRREMRKEAASAGFYECQHNKKSYPKIQLLTIEGLLSGHERAQFLDLSQGAVTFKKAAKEKGPKARQAKLL